jgi:hypothetical protein
MLLAYGGTARAFTTESLVNSGPSSNRLDLIIMGDGYRTQDQAQLTQDARNLLTALYAQDVNSRYRNLVNVRLVHVISTDNGADNGDFGATRDTALGAFFNCSGIDRLLCVDSAAVLNVAMTDTPEFDQIVVLANDTHYGGGGGQFAVSSIAPGASDIPVHELGHSLFDLADEYDTATPGFSRCDATADCVEPNVTVFSDRARNKWSRWIDATTSLPTADTAANASLVGAFEGARYFTTGQFRPVSNCIMRTLGRNFCPVCSEAGVLASYSFASSIDSLSPASPLALASNAPVSFTVQGPQPVPNTLSYTFRVDGNQVAQNTTGVYNTTGAALGAGNHTVTVAVKDTTTLVRADPSNLLAANGSWTVSVAPPAVGSFLSFENAARPWTVLFPTRVTTVSGASNGASALQINGCFYARVNSPVFTTTEIQPVTSRLAIDVKAKGLIANPLWTGTIILRITMPGALVVNTRIDAKTLLLSPLGSYQTLTFTVPLLLRTLMQQNFPGSSLAIEVETLDCLQPLIVDNIRFI